MKINYSGIETFTMLDYPGELACILFTYGCNFRCPYCYNDALVTGKQAPVFDDCHVESFLKSRRGKLGAVVFSGGECTLYGDKLYDDIKRVKDMGYKVKVDTNGTNPELIRRLITDHIIDYVALDIKCPPGEKEKLFYNDMTYMSKTLETLDMLINSDIKYEARTTVHPDITDENDINDIILLLEKHNYRNKYFIQFFFETPTTVGDVNPNPRKFKTELLKPYDGLIIEYRNTADNDKRI